MSAERLVRARAARIVDATECLKLIASDGTMHLLDGDSASLGRAVLDYLCEPRTRDEVLAHIAAQSGQPVAALGVVTELLNALANLRVVTSPAPASSEQPLDASRRMRIAVAVSGAVAAAHVPQFVQLLHRRGHAVRVALTRNARRFVSPLTLEALTHAPVVRSLWPRDAERPVPHLELAEWADLVVIYPTSATTLARLAAGDGSDIVSALALATGAPVVVVPSMNPAMYASSAVQDNLARVRAHGRQIVLPVFGHEVAERPDRRVPLFGPSPSPDDVAVIVDALLAEALARRVTAPVAASEWERMYKRSDGARLPWEPADIDADLLLAVSRRLHPGARLLEVGAGTGALAVALAARNYAVTATDISPTALAMANLREGSDRVVWLEDDVTRSRLQARFDGIVDRGCLHVLAPSSRAAYAKAMAALLRPGGVLIVKVHAPGVRGVVGTLPMSPDEVSAVLGPAFRLAGSDASAMPGVGETAPTANLCVLERVALAGD